MSSILVRRATSDDLDAYLGLQRSSWGDDMAVQEHKAKNRFDVALDGILMAEMDGRPVGTTTLIRLASYDFDRPMTWDAATGEGYCDTHRSNGSICFGVDLSVEKGSNLGVVDALMAGCMQLVIEAGTKYCVLGGRLPGYAKYVEKHPGVTADEYLWTKRNGKFIDPQVRMYAGVPGLKVLKLIPDYFRDPSSLDNGVLFRWHNPFYRWPFRRLWGHLPVWANNIYTIWYRARKHFAR